MTVAPARILQVEDDPDQGALFALVLSTSGYQVDTVPDAESALARMAETTYDLLLADWDLPGMNGDALITLVKARYPGVTTMLFSNHGHVDHIAKACGADAWLRKTEGIVRLREVVADLLAAGG